MLVSAKQFTAVAFDKCAPGGMRLFRGVIAAKVNLFVVYGRSCRKPSAVRRASDAARQVARRKAAVPKILLLSYLAQVFKAIVESIAVLVIDRSVRPRSFLHCPDEAMSQDVATVRAHENVAASPATSRLSRVFVVPSRLVVRALEVMQRARLPRQQSGLGIVDKALMKISG